MMQKTCFFSRKKTFSAFEIASLPIWEGANYAGGSRPSCSTCARRGSLNNFVPRLGKHVNTRTKESQTTQFLFGFEKTSLLRVKNLFRYWLLQIGSQFFPKSPLQNRKSYTDDSARSHNFSIRGCWWKTPLCYTKITRKKTEILNFSSKKNLWKLFLAAFVSKVGFIFIND